jgi:hypothetical protein
MTFCIEDYSKKSKNSLKRNLYHYTSLDVLYKIIENREFWISNSEYSNDKEEKEFAIEIMSEQIEKVVKAHNISDDIKEKIFKKIDEFESGDSYILCLSEDKDLLSQWRGYGDFGKGVSIGLNFKNSKKYVIKQENYEINKCSVKNLTTLVEDVLPLKPNLFSELLKIL